MRILIVGAGAVGSYYGACLWRAGHDVIFMARGPHREAMAQRGLRVVAGEADIQVHCPRLTDTEVELEPADLALVCTKLPDVARALEQAAPFISSQTIGLSLQNGVEADTLICEYFEPQNILLGATHVFVSIVTPGEVLRHTPEARIIFGERAGTCSDKSKTVLEALDVPGIAAHLSSSIIDDLWAKLSFVAPNAGACAYFHCSVGDFRSTGEGRALFQSLLSETVAVGRAQGANLSDAVETGVFQALDNLPSNVKASMLVDLERGKPLELHWLTGAVVRMGSQSGIDVQTSRRVFDALQPFALGNPPTATE